MLLPWVASHSASLKKFFFTQRLQQYRINYQILQYNQKIISNYTCAGINDIISAVIILIYSLRFAPLRSAPLRSAPLGSYRKKGACVFLREFVLRSTGNQAVSLRSLPLFRSSLPVGLASLRYRSSLHTVTLFVRRSLLHLAQF